MDDWLDRLAEALEVPRITSDELGTILSLAREVAHATERKHAPVSTFLLGVAAGAQTRPGTDRSPAFEAVVTTARALLPEASGA